MLYECLHVVFVIFWFLVAVDTLIHVIFLSWNMEGYPGGIIARIVLLFWSEEDKNV